MIAVILSVAVGLLSHSAAAPAHTTRSAHTVSAAHAAATTQKAATQTTLAVAASANFPQRGKLVPGQTLGGIALGMTEAQVVKIWGANYEVCTHCGSTLTWLFEYRGELGSGAAIKFNIPTPPITSTGQLQTLTGKAEAKEAALAAKARVIAVFTLGQPQGWGFNLSGVEIGDAPSDVYQLYGNTGSVQCIGYSAMTVDIGNVVTSFYTSSGVIYGYALTTSNESACE